MFCLRPSRQRARLRRILIKALAIVIVLLLLQHVGMCLVIGEMAQVGGNRVFEHDPADGSFQGNFVDHPPAVIGLKAAQRGRIIYVGVWIAIIASDGLVAILLAAL